MAQAMNTPRAHDNRLSAATRRLRRRLKKIRNALARRFFDTRYGRELLISAIGGRVTAMTVDCGDHAMTFDPGDYIGRKIFRKGHFERPNVERLLAVLRQRGLPLDGRAMLELGANIGTQTVYFSLANIFRHIVAVEPDPRNHRLLQANIAQNGLEAQVTALRYAVGERHGEIDFFQHRNNHGKSSALRQSRDDIQITVPVRPVDEILAMANVAAEDIGLVWMDIEGYEPAACRSMGFLMARQVPLYMEFSPVFYGRQTTVEFVRLLSRFYGDCMLFGEDGIRPIAVGDLVSIEKQADILLLPPDGRD